MTWHTVQSLHAIFAGGQFVGLCVYVYQSRACLHDNSSLIQARITKFGQEMQNTLI